jgi:DNA-binding CsgD family transcriptional regulator
MSNEQPRAAIIDPNTLSVLGLRQLLQHVMPILAIDGFGSMAELEANHPERYVHFFVALNVMLENRSFFLEHRRQTIVLTLSLDGGSTPTDFKTICINQPEKQLVHTLLHLASIAHGNGRNLPPMPPMLQQKILSDREIEVMSLIVQGLINKEIADRLSIGLSTVVTHRKNIMDKLGLKSVSALTIYAVMHGYVDINKLTP